MLDIKTFLSHLTTYPGVYQMLGEDGKILYVGKARNLKKRLSSYFSSQAKDIKTQALLQRIVDIQVTVTHSEVDALLLECNLIKKNKPHYNVLFRDDKSYPYILITMDEPYPCINFYRGFKKNKGLYFGPYPQAKVVRETIHLIQKLFGIRLCSDKYDPKKSRPCLQHQIGLCSGACAGLISQEDYQIDIQHAVLFLQGKNKLILKNLNEKMEHAASNLKFERAAKLRDQIAKLRKIQASQHVSVGRGNVDVVGHSSGDPICIQLLMIRHGKILGSRAYFPTVRFQSTPEEIISSFISQHYLTSLNENDRIPSQIIVDIDLPDAAILASTLSQLADKKIIITHKVRGERKKWIEIANSSAQQSTTQHLIHKTNLNARFSALEAALLLTDKIHRIECFDISHTMGESTVASCVVFNREGMLKSDYRRFNIKNITPGDDVAAMHQVLLRRYKKIIEEGNKLPDLILIDGGRTQLSVANKTLNELNLQHIFLMSVSKGEGRKPGLETLHLPNGTSFQLDQDSLALHLIQQIRDEAHRFAITGHRQQRNKKRLTSTLEEIPGIGAKRRRELLRYFGGIQGINHASLEDLGKVPGISQALAERIYDILHKR